MPETPSRPVSEKPAPAATDTSVAAAVKPSTAAGDKPSLPVLERLAAEGRNTEALQVALNILQAIDSRAGGLDGVLVSAIAPGSSPDDVALVFATRFASTFGRLLTAVDLKLTAEGYERLLSQYRWIDLIFALSGFRNSDCFLAVVAKPSGNGRLSFEGANVLRLLTMLTMNSSIDVDFDQFWRANRVAAAIAFLNYISSRYVFSKRAFEFRERLLEWIPDHLGEVKLGTVILSRLPEVYMHCSYAITAKKHAIKRPLMEQMRRACLEAGIVEPPVAAPPARGSEDTTVVVVGENFIDGHAVFRCFSRAVGSLRDRFKVVGVLYPNPQGTPAADFFDECIAIPRQEFLSSVRAVATEILARKPAVILYLGVGMVPIVIALASLRLAPIQCVSFGHTATTMSPTIDYFIMPEDFFGSQECFSEKTLPLPKEAMPFTSRQRVHVRRQASPGTIRVAIPASTMKLNPVLFDAIALIGERAKAQAAFHFFPLAATGLPYIELSRVVRARIPNATVHPQLPYERYMERLAQCDFFLCPFPYGNMNSIIDSFQLGLPGVCLDGAEAHAHADGAFFARINLPAELVTKSIDEYVAAAVRMIDDLTWRLRCATIVRTASLDAAFFRGDPGLFCDAIEDLIWPPT
jgi:hypothetical protein